MKTMKSDIEIKFLYNSFIANESYFNLIVLFVSVIGLIIPNYTIASAYWLWLAGPCVIMNITFILTIIFTLCAIRKSTCAAGKELASISAEKDCSAIEFYNKISMITFVVGCTIFCFILSTNEILTAIKNLQ